MSAKIIRLPAMPKAGAPSELTAINRWVVWKYVKGEDGKFTKPPFQSENPNRLASTKEPSTWSTYAEAQRAAHDGGVGFVIGGGIAALDLDDCIRDDGELEPWADELVNKSNSYAEVTPSRRGVRIIGFATGERVHEKHNKPTGHVELYRGDDCARFITISGTRLNQAPLRNIDALIDQERAKSPPVSDKDKSKSGQFHKEMCRLFERGWSVERIEREIKDKPAKYAHTSAQRFIAEGRLRGEIERCYKNWEKLDEFGDNFLTPMSAVKEKKINWVWYPYFARGELTIIEGDPGSKKSMFLQATAVYLVEDIQLPSKYQQLQAGDVDRVVLFDCENTGETVLKARLRHLGLKHADRILYREMPFQLTEDNVERVIELVRPHHPSIVAFDTLTDYFARWANTNTSRDVVQALQPFKQMAKELDCSVTLLRHLTKDPTKGAMYRGQGNISFTGKARIVLALGLDPENKSITRIATTKLNIVPEPEALTFSVKDISTIDDQLAFKFSWGARIAGLDADEVLGTVKNPGRPATELQRAEQFLLEALTDKGLQVDGRVEQRRIFTMARARDISDITLRRAARKLDVVKRQDRDGWWWFLRS